MQIGPYLVVDEIARGGHGVVYRAQDRQGQVVALKLLLAHRAQNPQARKRFQAEITALARLRHPHVVAIHGAGEHEGSPWLALEYVEGQTLEHRLQQGPLPIWEAIRIAQQLAQALDYVHSCGLLHRDLKPDNVLLRGNDALLTDFGLVLDDQSSLTRLTATGVFQGTPGYWAPEQARGDVRAFGPTTDVYGLGAVLYACLTGHAPVEALSLMAYLQTVKFKLTKPPRGVRPDVGEWLSDLCMRCLAFEPESRPASANEVARALVLAERGPVKPGARSSKRSLRVLAGVLGVVGSAGVGWWALGGGSALQRSGPEPRVSEVAEPHESPPEEDPAEQGSTKDAEQAVVWISEGKAKFDAGRYAEAIVDYDTAILLDPRSADAYANRGASKVNLGRHVEAIEDFDTAVRLDPRNAEAYSQRGTCKANLARYAEALEDFDTAIRLDPRNAEAYAHRGWSKASLNRNAEAVEDYDTAIRLNPRYAFAHANRGVIRANLGRHAEAIEDFDTALEFDPRNVGAYTNRGVSKTKLGRHGEAIEDYDRALEQDPRNAFARANRGVSKASLGRNAEAIEDYDTALQLGLPPAHAVEVRNLRDEAAAKLAAE